jgi:hypothetical protein
MLRSNSLSGPIAVVIALVIAAATFVSLTDVARAEDGRAPLPDKLTFGYEGEGTIDTSPKACLEAAREAVEWTEEETKKAGQLICEARKKHQEAYAAIQKSYKRLAAHIEPDHRLNPPEAVKGIEAMVKACIDHKTNINTGGHNIYIDIIPNHVAAACLTLGREVLDQESAWFEKGGFSEAHPVP